METKINDQGYEILRKSDRKGRAIRYHTLIAENILGKPLPKAAVVHHADGNRSNNQNSNLVICPNQKYHMLLHMRMRAKKACGHADWMKCYFCKKYDDQKNLKVYFAKKGPMAIHTKCVRDQSRKRCMGVPLKAQSNSSSKYIGVSWDKRHGKWVAQITVNHKRMFYGRYAEEREAAQAYNEAVKKYRHVNPRFNLAHWEDE